jgi:hypothetical protein
MPDPWAEACEAGVAVLAGGGYSSDGDAYTVQGVGRPVPTGRPVLDALAPATMAAADPDTALSCQGSGFTRDCAIAFAGRLERTDFISDTELSTVITGGGMWAPGTQPVQVVSEGRGSSDSQTFTFT